MDKVSFKDFKSNIIKVFTEQAKEYYGVDIKITIDDISVNEPLEDNKRVIPLSREDLDLDKYIIKNDKIAMINNCLKQINYFDQITILSLFILADHDDVVNYPEVVVGALKDLYIDWKVELFNNTNVSFKLK